MIRLPPNVDQLNNNTITLRFASATECAFLMLKEAGASRLARYVWELESEAQAIAAIDPAEDEDAEVPRRTAAQIAADRLEALTRYRQSSYQDGQGAHCLVLTVRDAISLVTPIEQIEKLAKLDVPVTAHDFTPQQVAEAARATLTRFEESIDAVARAAPALFLPAPGGPGN